MKLSTSSTTLLFAGSLTAFAAVLPALAQAPAPSPAAPSAAPAPSPAPAAAAAPPGRAGPPGSALYDRPESEGAKKLAPVAPPPIPLAADKFQLDKLKVPEGFKIEV